MKKLKIIGLTIYLFIGILIPSCNTGLDDCSFGPVHEFFDIQDIQVFYSSEIDPSELLSLNDKIAFDDLGYIYVDYVVEYVVSAEPRINNSFSLLSSAMGCSIVAGTKGSKEEELISFSIITLNDFDATHPANSNINDLFEYFGGSYNYYEAENPISLIDYINSLSGFIQQEDMVLKLIKAPDLDQEFKIKVVMELSTDEVHEFESDPIYITK